MTSAKVPRVMRIGFLSNNPSPHQVDLLSALGARPDVDLFVGYVFANDANRTWGTPTPELPWSILPCDARSVAAGKLRRWLIAHPADIWVVTSNYSSWRTHYIIRLLRKNGSLVTYLGEPPRPRRDALGVVRKLVLKNMLRHVNGVMGTGRGAAERYTELVGRRKPIESVPYSVELTALTQYPMPVTPEAGHPVRFVTSSQLIHRKGLDVLIRACEQLSSSGWTLEIYGSGELEQPLRAQAESTGKPIRFCGTVPYDRRAEVFLEKHCFVFPTRWDGWGMVLPEAMAMGLPVISTNMAMSAVEFVRDGHNGFLGPADSPEFLATAMKRLIENPLLVPEFANAARETMLRYTPEINAETLYRFLERVLTMSGKPCQ